MLSLNQHAIQIGALAALIGGMVTGCGEPEEILASASTMQAVTTAPTATNVTINFNGPNVTGAYTFSSAAGRSERGSWSAFYRSSNASDTDKVSVWLTNTMKMPASVDNQYLQYCVLPFDDQGTMGQLACSPWKWVGPVAGLFADANFSNNYVGTSLGIPYESMGNFACVNLADYGLNDTASSLKITARPGNYTWLGFYSDPNCSGTRARIGAASGSTASIADLGTVGMDNRISSVRVIWSGEASRPMNGDCVGPGTTPLETDAGSFTFQSDGNVVFYHKHHDGSRPVFATGTNGTSQRNLCFQSDNNLVLYNTRGRASWASGSNGSAGRIVLQFDCNLVIYDGNGVARWNSNSTCW